MRSIHYSLHFTKEKVELAKVSYQLKDEALGQTLIHRSHCDLFPQDHGAFQQTRHLNSAY